MFAARFLWLTLAFILPLLPPAATRAAPLCADYPYDSAPRIAALLDGLNPLLPVFPSMLDLLEARRPEICLDDEPSEAYGYLDATGARLVLSADLALPMQRLILLHELRHLRQVQTGACPLAGLSMEANARAVMAMEADACAISLLAAWHLRETGDPSVWEAAEAWPSQCGIAAVVAREMRRSDDPAAAMAAAFAHWFTSRARRENYYIAACSDYLDAQDRSKGLARYDALPQSFLSTLCRLPDGQAYPCALPETDR